MATLYAKLSTARNRGGHSVIDSVPVNKTSIVTSGTTQRINIASPAQDYRSGDSKPLFWSLVAIGGNVWVKAGDKTVEASAGNDHYLKDGVPFDCAVSGDSPEYIAVIDA